MPKTFLFIAIGLLIVSYFFNRQKTVLGLKKGLKQFATLLPTLLLVVILVSSALHFIPKEALTRYFGEQAGALGYLSAIVVGSISLIPGLVSYPMAGMLVKSGVGYGVIALFITTLKMVGILTLPLEAKYLGLKVALLRNGLSLIGAIVIGWLMVFFFYLV